MIVEQIQNLESELKLISYLNSGKALNTEEITTSAHKFFQNKYWTRSDVDSVIPEIKHKERLDLLRKKINDYELKLPDSETVLENLVVFIQKMAMSTQNIIFIP